MAVPRRSDRARRIQRSLSSAMNSAKQDADADPSVADSTSMIQLNTLMAGPSCERGQPLEDEHGEEPQPGDHRPLDDAQPQNAVSLLAGAHVDRKAHETGNEKEQDDPAKDQHRASSYHAGASSAKPAGAWLASSKVTSSWLRGWLSTARSSLLFRS